MREIKWVINVGDSFKEEKRDITIIERKIRRVKRTDNKTKKEYIANEKWYKYHCNKCGNEDWVIEGAIKPKEMKGQSVGCNVCIANPLKAVLGRNTIWDKARWMCDLGVSEKDAKTYAPQSNKRIEVVCPHCGNIKMCNIADIYNNHSIGCVCSDKVSSGEKIVYSILKQLCIEFKYQLTKRDVDWCDGYRYDFYIPILDTIIETHGEQHYKETTNFKKTLKYIKDNDDTKKNLALQNGISKYIVIDCKKSNLDYIKDNIYQSELANLIDLKKIDWDECFRFTFENNLIKEACTYKKDNPNYTTTDIAKIMGFNYNTIRNWLKIGNKLGWCNYIPTK